MNWLDIILIIIASLITLTSIAVLIYLCTEEEIGMGIAVLCSGLFVAFLTGIAPFITIDKAQGSTIGTITSVDKNFFGTTAIYVKVSETAQEQYCIENKSLSSIANSLIGERIKITYGTRVGFYSTGKCNQAPVNKIERINSNE